METHQTNKTLLMSITYKKTQHWIAEYARDTMTCTESTGNARNPKPPDSYENQQELQTTEVRKRPAGLD